jgi:hypothetical protein
MGAGVGGEGEGGEQNKILTGNIHKFFFTINTVLHSMDSLDPVPIYGAGFEKNFS